MADVKEVDNHTLYMSFNVASCLNVIIQFTSFCINISIPLNNRVITWFLYRDIMTVFSGVLDLCDYDDVSMFLSGLKYLVLWRISSDNDGVSWRISSDIYGVPWRISSDTYGIPWLIPSDIDGVPWLISGVCQWIYQKCVMAYIMSILV